MKKKILLIILFFSSYVVSYSQNCDSYSRLSFGSDEEISQFVENGGFHGCTKIGSLTIGGTVSDLTAFNGITYIESLNIFSASKLSGLIHVKHIGALDIKSSFDGLNELETVGSIFMGTFDDYPLVSVSGFTSLKSVTEWIYIGNHTDSLPDFKSLTTVGGTIWLMGNTDISSFNGFHFLVTCGGIYIAENTNLHSIIGFGQLKNVLGEFRIVDNPDLSYITGFDELSSISSFFYLYRNSNLHLVTGFDNLETIKGDYLIQENPSLEHLPNTKALSNIGGTLYITNNSSLVDLYGINNLKSVSILGIGDNPSLSSISDLKGLTNIISLDIRNCNSLSSLAGLENIDPQILNNIWLISCKGLSFCSLPNICNFIDHGFSSVADNAQGCSSVTEIKVACSNLGVSSTAGNPVSDSFAYPNPTTSILHLDSSNLVVIDKVSVIDVTGKTVLQQNGHAKQINVEKLTQGIYLVEIYSGNDKFQTKFIKK